MAERFGADRLSRGKTETELRGIKKEMTVLKKRLSELQARKTELETALKKQRAEQQALTGSSKRQGMMKAQDRGQVPKRRKTARRYRAGLFEAEGAYADSMVRTAMGDIKGAIERLCNHDLPYQLDPAAQDALEQRRLVDQRHRTETPATLPALDLLEQE